MTVRKINKRSCLSCDRKTRKRRSQPEKAAKLSKAEAGKFEQRQGELNAGNSNQK
jgi:hypothetical protein